MLKTMIRLDMVSVSPEDSVRQVVQLMKTKNVGCVLVCDSVKKPVGIITDRDLVLRCMAENKDFNRCTARDVMTPSPRLVHDHEGLFDAITAMRESQVRRIPVVDAQGKALGIISFGDILAILSKEFHTLVENTTHPLVLKTQPKKASAA
ncbi:MAG: Hypoxic response protein 1 [Pseudomonadota bacterium]|jgi:CBS domain-containing protein